jgi:hypothetical protein
MQLNDEEMQAVMAAAAPIAFGERNRFLRELAAELAQYTRSEIGPGLVHRAAAVVQRGFVLEARREVSLAISGGNHSRSPRGAARAAR